MRSETAGPSPTRPPVRRGVVFLYTLSVLMIVLSLGLGFVRFSSSTVRHLSASEYTALAYQAALSGQSYGMSYLSQLIDFRNGRWYLGSGRAGPCPPMLGPGGFLMEEWAGRELCPAEQPGAGGPGTMPGIASWFHYGDVIIQGTAQPRYRLWFRLVLTESLTRNSLFYSDICGGMSFAPFTPATYPDPAQNILYTLVSIGHVQVWDTRLAAAGVFNPGAYCRVDASFQLQCAEFSPDALNPNCTIGQPPLVLVQHVMEVVRDPPNRMRPFGPDTSATFVPPNHNWVH